MKRILLSGVSGGLVLLIWGNLTWMVLPLHMPTIKGLPNESDVSAALKDVESGVYVAPWSTNEADWSNPESEFMKRHESGPLYSIFIKKQGGAAMDPSMFLGGFIINFLAASLAACLLSSAVRGSAYSYMQCVGFVFGLGLIVALLAHLNYWNWMNFDLGYTIGWVIDVSVGCGLMGLPIAAIIKPQTIDESTSSPEA